VGVSRPRRRKGSSVFWGRGGGGVGDVLDLERFSLVVGGTRFLWMFFVGRKRNVRWKQSCLWEKLGRKGEKRLVEKAWHCDR